MWQKKKHSEKNARIFLDYLAATGNEIAIDSCIVNGLTDRGPNAVGYLPRAGKWVNLSNQFPRAIRSIAFACRFIWIGGAGPVFFFIQLLSSLLSASSNKSNARVGALGQGFVLALSSRVGDIVHPSTFGALPDIWITMPWAPLRRMPDSAVSVDIFSLLTKDEFWQAYCYAVRASYIIFWRKKTSNWVLQSYTAFRWFAVRFAIDKLSGRMVMAEHCDRWAVLVDGSVRANRKSVLDSSVGQDSELILIQHGALGELGSSAGKALGAIKLPRKLGAVSQLYVYGSEAEEAFKRDVLTEGCVRRGLKVHYFKPTIELTDVAAYPGLKLLFVGHPLCEAFQEEVFERLCSQYEFKGYYKPHPLAPMSGSIRQVGWEIIENVAMFPVVDLLIAYPSTLVVEYEGLGIPAAVHPMNLGCGDAVSYMKSVCELIDSIKAKHAFQ